MKFLPLSLVTITLAACSGSGDPSALTDDETLDALGITESSPEARAVVRVANETPLNAMIVEIGLQRRTARSILFYRWGPDETPDTDDDRTIETFAEVDAIRYVGPVSLGRMLVYADMAGWLSSDAGALRVPLFGDDGALLATHNDALATAGRVPFPESIDISADDHFPGAEFMGYWARASELFDLEILDVEMMAFSDPAEIPGLCFTGTPGDVPDLMTALADKVFSDQLLIYGAEITPDNVEVLYSVDDEGSEKSHSIARCI